MMPRTPQAEPKPDDSPTKIKVTFELTNGNYKAETKFPMQGAAESFAEWCDLQLKFLGLHKIGTEAELTVSEVQHES